MLVTAFEALPLLLTAIARLSIDEGVVIYLDSQEGVVLAFVGFALSRILEIEHQHGTFGFVMQVAQS